MSKAIIGTETLQTLFKETLNKSRFVIPAKAGIQYFQ